MSVQLKPLLMMSTAEKRETLRQKIDELDEKFIEAIYAIVEAYEEKEEDPIIGYDIEGNPKRASVMKKIYNEQVKNAIEKGEFITIEDLEKEMETW